MAISLIKKSKEVHVDPRTVPSFRTSDVTEIERTLNSQYKAGYEANPYVFRCVNLIADTCAGVDPLAFNKNNKEIKGSEHPITKLMRRPNPRTSWPELVRDVQTYLGINGNAFLCPVKTTFGGVSELYSIPPDKVMPELNAGDPINPVRSWLVTLGATT